MKKIILLFVPVLFLSVFAGAQIKSVYDQDFVAKTKQDAAEVFKNHMAYAGSEYLKVYLNHLSRLEIKAQAPASGEAYPSLSEVMLINKYNPQLQRDDAATFDPLTFNALKYNFNYDSDADVIYRVDGTNYIIVIHPAK